MQVVLLAAGLGARLGRLTQEIPKALIAVDGEPLLIHALRFARLIQPTQIIVVGGYGFDQVEAQLSRWSASAAKGFPIQLLHNHAYRRGSILSLLTALPQVREDFVLLNVDHIFRPSIAPLVRTTRSRVTGYVDIDRVLGVDDMKVKRDDQDRIVAIAKTLTSFDCGYVGMTRVPISALPAYRRQAQLAADEDGESVAVERVLARLARGDEGPEHQPDVCDVSGHGWLEVDMPDERDRAEEAVRGGGWR